MNCWIDALAGKCAFMVLYELLLSDSVGRFLRSS
jgi:hypothetical protein